MTNKIEIIGAGRAVTVYEEKPEVGHRFHGDFQGLENWSLKEDVKTLLFETLGIQETQGRDFICQPYSEVTVFDAHLNRTAVNSGVPTRPEPIDFKGFQPRL